MVLTITESEDRTMVWLISVRQHIRLLVLLPLISYVATGGGDVGGNNTASEVARLKEFGQFIFQARLPRRLIRSFRNAAKESRDGGKLSDYPTISRDSTICALVIK